MKLPAAFAGAILLTGCPLGASQDIKNAEKLLADFQCNKIESAQMAHSPITAYHEQSLHGARQKAEQYIQSYKNGEKLFTIPLSTVIEQQYSIYKEACQNLGGVHQNILDEN
jgi:hypothetical protein